MEAGIKRKNDTKTEDRDRREPKKKKRETFDNFTRFPVRARPHSNPCKCVCTIAFLFIPFLTIFVIN